MTLPREDSGPADLLGIGQHCAFPECHQLDFLPFKCSGCEQTFCLEHRGAAAHRCVHAPANDAVVVCPTCAKAIKVAAGEDANVAYERHSRTDCDPANYVRVHKKPRCPVPHCREKLTSLNSFVCKECGATVCLKHRLSLDHKCPGRPAPPPTAAARLGSSFRNLFQQAAPSGAKPAAAKAPAAKPAAKPAARAKASASTQAQLQAYRAKHTQHAQHAQPAQPSTSAQEVVDLTRSPSPAGGASNSAERCPQCGAGFASVQQLIDHAAAAHQDGWRSGGLSGGGERCPHCGLECVDAVALVEHVEAQHSGGRSAAALPASAQPCVLS